MSEVVGGCAEAANGYDELCPESGLRKDSDDALLVIPNGGVATPRAASLRLSQGVFVSTRSPRRISVPMATISASFIGCRSLLRLRPSVLARYAAQGGVHEGT